MSLAQQKADSSHQGGEPESADKKSPRRATAKEAIREPKVGRRPGKTFVVAGFWKRLLAAFVDLAVIVPVCYLLCKMAAALADIHIPNSRVRGVDFWLDLLLAKDPALLGAIGLFLGIACTYILVFHISMGRTVGMRALKLRIIDGYGDPPSIPRAVARTLGYLASAGSMGLGFLWIAFDSEKRGLHDWLAGTYVVKLDESSR